MVTALETEDGWVFFSAGDKFYAHKVGADEWYKHDTYEAARAHLPKVQREAQEGLMDWRPIETLPHNGDEEDRKRCGHWHGPVLVFVPDLYGGVMLVAQLDSGMWILGNDKRTFAELQTEPTHWMPLPPPPDTDSAIAKLRRE